MPAPGSTSASTQHTMLNATVNLGDVAHAIQLALAPVFLLTGVAGILNVMAGRLARIIDLIMEECAADRPGRDMILQRSRLAIGWANPIGTRVI